MTSNLLPEKPWLCCKDCGLPYSDAGWADFVVTDVTWAKLTEDDGDAAGVLCACCMIRRAVRLGIQDPSGRFTSGPFVADNTRPAPAGMAEIVAAAEAWVEAERTIFHAGSERQADEAAHGITAARARFLALVAAHAAEVAKVMEPFAELAALLFDNEGDDTLIWGRTSDGEAAIRLKHVRAAADLRRRVTAAPHEKKEG